MRIALLTITRGTVSAGYAKYLDEIVPRLRAASDVEELRVYVPAAMASRDATHRAWSDLRSLRAEVLAWRPDVVFIPSSVYLDLPDIPLVTMVHNMEPLEVPFDGNSAGDALRNVARAYVGRRACAKSARVIAVSQHVRDFLVDRWKVDAEKVGVVYHGVDLPESMRRPAAVPDAPFLFTGGSIRPARGLDDLAGALPLLPRDLHVVIAGGADAGSMKYAAQLRARMNDPRVVWLGRVPAEEMAWCFANARLFAMTSRAEACPNTVLESLALGSLNVSTDKAPMPEFYRDAALYYQRRDARDLGRAMNEALALDESAANALRARARARSQDFTWDATLDGALRELRLAIAARR